MRAALAIALIAALVWGAAGCIKPSREAERPPEERMLGVRGGDSRFKEETAADVAAELSKPRGGLRLAASLDKEAYKENEPLLLDVRLENITGGRSGQRPLDIPVYFEPFAKMPNDVRGEWLLKFSIQSEDDGKVVYRSPDFPVPEKDRANYYHFVVLPEQSSVGRKFEFPPAVANDNWLTPGKTYSIIVSYIVSDEYPYVILNRNFTAAQVEGLGLKLAYVRVWTGKLSSAPVTFTVERKHKRRFLIF